MKKLVNTFTHIYDKTGKHLGYEVVEVDGYTEQDLKNDPQGFFCGECGAFNGGHREYFVKTGQCNAGSVEGHYNKCKTGGMR